MGLGSTTAGWRGVCQHQGTTVSLLVASSPPRCLLPIQVSVTTALMLPMASHRLSLLWWPRLSPALGFPGVLPPKLGYFILESSWVLSASLIRQKHGIKPQMLLHLIKNPRGSGDPHGCCAKHPVQGANPKPDEDPVSSPAPHEGSAKG